MECGERDLNPHDLNDHRHLKPARLPIPPSPQVGLSKLTWVILACVFTKVKHKLRSLRKKKIYYKLLSEKTVNPAVIKENRTIMLEYLDQNKDLLIDKMKNAPGPDAIEQIIREHLDRMLIEYTEYLPVQYKEPLLVRFLSQYAGALIAAAKESLRLIDSNGEPEIWENKSPNTKNVRKGRLSGTAKAGLTLTGAGNLVIWVFLLVRLLSPASAHFAVSAIVPAVILTLLSLAGCFLLLKGKSASVKGGFLRAVTTYDCEKIFRTLRAITASMDRSLQDIPAWAEDMISQNVENGTVDEEELRLFSDLLEAECTNDGQIALDALSQIRFHLHRRGIEVFDYVPVRRTWFEMIPATDQVQDATLRPALVKDEMLLRKGLAARYSSGENA